MSHTLAFLCPVCKTEDTIDASHCRECGSTIKISPSGIHSSSGDWSLPDYLDWMRETLLPEQADQILQKRCQDLSLQTENTPLRISLMAELRQGKVSAVYTGFGNLFRRRLWFPKSLQKGVLIIYADHFTFMTPRQTLEFKLADLTCVTTNSHYFEFKIRKTPFYQIHFHYESPLKYEILFQKLLGRYHQHQKKQIYEFQPKVRLSLPSWPAESQVGTLQKSVNPSFLQAVLRWILLFKLRLLLRLFIRVKVVHPELIPKSFPFIMLLNHQSIFDPFIILAFLDHRIGFLTKSTSFSNGVTRWLLRLGKAIPTTRYETDPTVIRHIRKYLECGLPVGIFPEGERSWDGGLLPMKWGVVRLLVHTRIPVLPVVIENSFGFMPRWDHKPHRQEIQIQVGAPFCLTQHYSDIQQTKSWLESNFLNIFRRNKKDQSPRVI